MTLSLLRPSTPIEFPAEFAATYDEPRSLEDGGQSQIVVMQRGEEQLALGVRSYPNPDRLPAERWIRAKWDPQNLLALRPFAVAAGTGVQLMSADAWTDANEGEMDFPMLVTLNVGDRIVIIDKLNGVPIENAIALELIAHAKAR